MAIFASFDVIRIFLLTTTSFIVAILWTPLLTHILYKYRLGKNIRDGNEAPIYARLHAKKAGTPVMGGVLVWVTTIILALFFFYFSFFTQHPFFVKLNFLSRSQTLLPLGALLASAVVGLIDDIFNVRKQGAHGGGLRVRHKLLLYTLIAVVGAGWFFFKLQWDVIHVPLFGNFSIGWWYIPLFVLVIVSTSFSVNEIDGLDGLAAGTLLTAFFAYGGIAFVQGKMDLAALCGVIGGSLFAFLWFNIYPARFFMGDTGSMALGTTLGIVAMLTNYALLLPLIAFPLVIESLSVILQLASKKLRRKKIFQSTPLHHHLEAIGWPEPKIVMRFWVIAVMSSIAGLILFLLDLSMKGF